MYAILIILLMAGFLALIGMKIFPIFFEHWQLQSIVQDLSEDPEIGDLSVREVSKRFSIRMQTNNIRDVNFDEAVFIEKVDGSLWFYIEYERRVNVYSNIDAIVSFDESTEKVL